jgi:hypothetical protein
MVTRLPVWDAVTCCDFFLSASSLSSRLQIAVDGSAPASPALTLARLPLAAASGDRSARRELADESAVALAKSRMRATPPAAAWPPPCDVRKVGVLRCENSGASALPSSANGLRAILKCVENLDSDSLRMGMMNTAVRNGLRDAVEALEMDGCIAITGESGWMLQYEEAVREFATVPVFLSAMVQCPLVAASLEEGQKAVVLTLDRDAIEHCVECVLTCLAAKHCAEA